MAEQPFLPFDEPEPRPAAPAAVSVPPAAGLIDSLARVCRERPLEEKILVAPSLAIGHTLVERLAREGHPWIHLRVETVRTIALDLVGAGPRARGFAPALAGPGAGSRRAGLRGVSEARSPTSAQLRDRPGFHRALQRTFEEIRAAGLSAAALPAGAFDDPRKLKELQGILSRYDADLAKGRFIDSAAVLRRAVDGGGAGPGGARVPRPGGRGPDGRRARARREGRRRRLEILAIRSPRHAGPPCASQARLLRAERRGERDPRGVSTRSRERDPVRPGRDPLHRPVHLPRARLGARARARDAVHVFARASPRRSRTRARRRWRFSTGSAAASRPRSCARGPRLGSADLRPPPRPRPRAAPGTRAVARALREAQIGWGARRHRPALDRLIAELDPARRARTRRGRGRRERKGRARRTAARGACRRAARARAFAVRVLELSRRRRPRPATCGLSRAGCRDVRRASSRASPTRMDATALTALEKLLEELEVLPSTPLPPAEAAARLSDAVRALSIDADRPRPGRVHVAEYRAGGFSGRPHTYLLGLDEARHPGADLEDPVLLDAERRQHQPHPRAARAAALPGASPRVGAGPPGSASRALLGRADGELLELEPAQPRPAERAIPVAVLPGSLPRPAPASPEADYSDLLDALPRGRGVSSRRRRRSRRDRVVALAARGGRPVRRGRRGRASRLATSIRTSRTDIARRKPRASEEFTIYDGWVRGGTPELDPRASGEPQSASRLETLAQCPFRYFLKHVLRIEPPKELERDTTEWLDAMTAGSLLHEVFRLFFERITAAGEKPEAARARARCSRRSPALRWPSGGRRSRPRASSRSASGATTSSSPAARSSRSRRSTAAR